MSYADVQMIIASQIAYIDFDADAVDSGQYTVKELLEMQKERVEGEKAGSIQKLLDRIDENEITRACGNWKIKDIRDNQSTSGMYGCLLDTGDGNALIGFRGSESDSPEDFAKDWIISDFGLVNNIQTPQQATAEKYMADIYKKYGSEYNGFGLTGHSLGGNLAEHATITAPDEMRDKIIRCVNLDGPGFSNKYLAARAGDINKAQGLITHYQWSWCGGLLNPVPGSYHSVIKAETPDKGFIANSMAWRHDTYNVKEFDENGNALHGEKDWFALLLEPLADGIDLSVFAITGGAMSAVLYQSVHAVKEGFANLWRQWQGIRFGGQAQFELDARAVDSQIEEFSEMIPRVRELQAGMERIQRELAFDSLAAGYVKFKLWSTANAVGSDVQKIEKFCDKGRECTRCYQICEQRITNNYKN